MYVGKDVRRVEDERFLRGKGRFVDDVALTEKIIHAAYTRSPHPHARLKNIKTDKARAMPGVITVLTGQDWLDGGYGEAEGTYDIPDRSGKPANSAFRPFLAVERVRHVGEAVAMVVAESRNQSMDATEAIEVEYDPLPANTVTARALDPDTAILHERFGTNLVQENELGDEKATEAAFAKAAHITECEVSTNRVTAAPIEPRSYLGIYDSVEDRYTLWDTAQAPHMVRDYFTKSLKIPEHKLRVISPDVGGGFGMKIYHYPEEATVLWAAKVTGRPVRWTGTRSESLASDTHARDHYTLGRMAFDENGKILGARFDTIAAFGAYESQYNNSISQAIYPLLLSCGYDIPAIYCLIKGVYTNATPIDAYRGAGRPEATYALERLLENGAHELGIDAVELRERNIIQPEQFPYQTSVASRYDIADLPVLMSKTKALCSYDELREEQKRLRDQGLLMGIGSSCFFDAGGVGPTALLNAIGQKFGGYDVASVRVHPSGMVTIFAGSHSHGQSHATTWAQIAADRLGCPIENIEVVEGDTDRIPFGIGTWGSRSLSTAGMAVAVASDRAIDKAKILAAHMLECAPDDLALKEGNFAIEGTDRSLTFAEVAHACYHRGDRPEGLELGLEETSFFDPIDFTYPSAVHICVVLVDPDTGRTTLRDYWAVDDVGRVINPMVVEGQVHGGLAQGIGQALMEECTYDESTAQYLSGTFMDYAIPRAEDLPSFGMDNHVTLAPSNPLGVKCAGESGTIGAPACVCNAVIDAVWHLGIHQISQPMTAAKIWQAITEAA